MTPATVPRVPNKPKTPMKSFRIPDDIYQAAQKAAAANSETLTDVVRRSLVNYARRHKTPTIPAHLQHIWETDGRSELECKFCGAECGPDADNQLCPGRPSW